MVPLSSKVFERHWQTAEDLLDYTGLDGAGSTGLTQSKAIKYFLQDNNIAKAEVAKSSIKLAPTIDDSSKWDLLLITKPHISGL